MNNLPVNGKRHITITVLYDNYLFKEKLKTGTLVANWGFSCLVEGTEKTILFDTGSDGETLLSNMRILGINPEIIDTVVISHNHWDHIGGLLSILERNNKASLFLPASDNSISIENVSALKILLKKETVEICKDVFLTGEMGTNIKEQSIILNTNRGLIVITGCAHPGIVDILKKTKEIIDRDIYFVLGGFHLKAMTDNEINKIISEFRNLGVLKVGPAHCTGDKAIRLFKSAYGENFVKIGVGKVLQF